MAEIKTYGVAIPFDEMHQVVNTKVGKKLLATAQKYKSLLGVHPQPDYIYFLFRLRAEAMDFLLDAEEQGYHPWARGVAYVDTKDMPREV